jgi:hypothetical protein
MNGEETSYEHRVDNDGSITTMPRSFCGDDSVSIPSGASFNTSYERQVGHSARVLRDCTTEIFATLNFGLVEHI